MEHERKGQPCFIQKNVDMLLIHFTIAKLRYLKPEPTAVSMQCGKRTGSEGEGVTE